MPFMPTPPEHAFAVKGRGPAEMLITPSPGLMNVLGVSRAACATGLAELRGPRVQPRCHVANPEKRELPRPLLRYFFRFAAGHCCKNASTSCKQGLKCGMSTTVRATLMWVPSIGIRPYSACRQGKSLVFPHIALLRPFGTWIATACRQQSAYTCRASTIT